MTDTTVAAGAARPTRATRAARAEQAPDGRPHWAVLPVVLTATFMITLDFFIVNVAIPSLQSNLHAGPAAIQWVVAGFGLAVAAVQITASRLGDAFGRRRVFTVGLVLFTVTSAACGLAPTAGLLVAGRVLQGVSAALITPQVLAILRTSYSGAAQARAFSMFGLSLGIGGVFGQLIGGLLIRADVLGLDWRTCFLINVPVGVAAVALTPRVVPESRGPARAALGIPGMMIASLALVAIVLPLIQGRQAGWPAWTWPSLAGGCLLLAAFAWYQHRVAARGGSPLIDPALFRERAFTVGLLAQLVFWTGQASFFLVLALYLQQGRALTALASGVVFTAIGAGYLITSSTAHHLARRLGRQVIAAGAVIMVAGLALLRAGAVPGAGVGWLVPGLLVDGLGMGMVLAPLAVTVLARVTPQHAGPAAGVLSTVQQVGNALGVALLGIVFYGALGGGVPHAFRGCLIFLIVVELALAALVQLLPKDPARA
jgi:EmrB/QacA subfamily drug resistance transporter